MGGMELTRNQPTGRYGLVLVTAFMTIGAGVSDVQIADEARSADWASVRALVARGHDVSAPQADGATALHWASYWDEREIADLLIRAGADVDAATDLGVTPLWAASENGSLAMVEALLRAGANPNAELLSGETPLMAAARTGNAEVLKQLLSSGADVDVVNYQEGPYGGQTALMWAVSQQHSAVVAVLLAKGADVHARSNTFIETVKTTRETANVGTACRPREQCYAMDIQAGGFTPLLFAARVGDLDSARLLVAAGADVNDLAPQGTRALVVAAHSGHGKLAAFLLDRGADPNATDAGYSALHAAILHKDVELVQALLAAGADPNAPLLASTPTRRDSVDFYFHPSFVGATPFWLAARFRAAEIMRLLAMHGADPLFVHSPAYWTIDRQNFGRQRWIAEGSTTALMAAVGMGGRDPLISVDHRARVAEDARVASRQPDPAEVADMTLEAVRVAVELGVHVDVANANGETALHGARARGYETVAEFLLEHGTRPDDPPNN